MRSTTGELYCFADKYLQSVGKTFYDMAKCIGIKKEVFSMWKLHPEMSPKLETVIAMANYMGITMNQLVGQEPMPYTDEILNIVELLKQMSPIGLQFVYLAAKSYCEAEIEKSLVVAKDNA